MRNLEKMNDSSFIKSKIRNESVSDNVNQKIKRSLRSAKRTIHKNNACYQRIVYLISICDTEAFAADKNVGFFSLKQPISRSLKDANEYFTISGAKRRIERINQEGHFSSDYYFNVTEYDRQTGIMTNIPN